MVTTAMRTGWNQRSENYLSCPAHANAVSLREYDQKHEQLTSASSPVEQPQIAKKTPNVTSIESSCVAAIVLAPSRQSGDLAARWLGSVNSRLSSF